MSEPRHLDEDVVFLGDEPTAPSTSLRRQWLPRTLAFAAGVAVGVVGIAGYQEVTGATAGRMVATALTGDVYVPDVVQQSVTMANPENRPVEVLSVEAEGWAGDTPSDPVTIPARGSAEVPLPLSLDCVGGSPVPSVLHVRVATELGDRSYDVPMPEDATALERARRHFCGRDGETAPTLENLEGIWLAEHSDDGLLYRLGADGTYALDVRGDLLQAPGGSGTFSVDGRRIRFTGTGGDFCSPREPWEWQGGVTDDGILRAVHALGGSGTCSGEVGEGLTFRRVSPASPAGEWVLRTHEVRSRLTTPSSVSELQGIWLLPGGTVLRITVGGYYQLDARGRLDDPQDSGTVTLDPAGRLVMVSGESSRICAAGQRLTRGDLQFADRVLVDGSVLAQGVLVGAVQDECGDRFPGRSGWVRLSGP